MPCCSASDVRRLVAWLAALLLSLAAGLAGAGQIEPREAELRATDEGWTLTADFAVDLGPRLEDAVARGVPLFFRLEFVLERPRKYWVAEHVVTRVTEYRLSYSSLTRQYRLSSGALHQNFASLPEALRLLGRVGSLVVAERGALQAGETYHAAVRLSLDRNQLPKPFQVDAITDREWQVEAKTRRWSVVP